MDTPFLIPVRQDPLAVLLSPQHPVDQPPLMHAPRQAVTAAIASLAIGGAERIVLDWAASCAGRYRTRLIVLHDLESEWPVPAGIEVVRLGGTNVRLGGTNLLGHLESTGAAIVRSGNPVVLCHLLTAPERAALARGGADPLPVLHNASAGWRETAHALRDTRRAIAVSSHAANELYASGWRGHCAVIRHIPKTPARRIDARRAWRTRWALPQDAVVIGMIGAVKPQKAYTRALRILAALSRPDAYLVIIGGRPGRPRRDSRLAGDPRAGAAARARGARATTGIHFRRVRLPACIRSPAQ